MALHSNNSLKNIYFNSSISTTMTSQDTSVVEFPIASTRLRSLILKKHISTLNTQLTQEKKADPHLTRMILLNMFQIFQINKINFQQYLKLHKHPYTFIQKCDATTQTDYTTIRPKPFVKNLSNRMRTPLKKKNLAQYWLSDDNDSTMMNFKRIPLKQFLIKILNVNPLLPLQFEADSELLQHNIRCLDSSTLLNTPQQCPTGNPSTSFDHLSRLQLTTLHS